MHLVMTSIPKTLFILVLSLAAAACGRLNPFGDEPVLAQVGEKKLYRSDVRSLFTEGMSPADSLKLLESYVDVWVKKQLKVQQAEELFVSSSDDIERMVEEYRSSLLTHKLDQYYVEIRMDTVYTDSAMMAYYNGHRSDFLLDRPVVKGRILRLPDNARQKKKLKELISERGEKLLDFRDISYKNGYLLTEFDSWTDFGDFLAALPVSRTDSNEELLSRTDVIELKQDDYTYFAYITGRLRAGEPNPPERIWDNLRRVLFNQRRQEIIRSYEDSLMRAALDGGQAEIKIDKNE